MMESTQYSHLVINKHLLDSNKITSRLYAYTCQLEMIRILGLLGCNATCKCGPIMHVNEMKFMRGCRNYFGDNARGFI